MLFCAYVCAESQRTRQILTTPDTKIGRLEFEDFWDFQKNSNSPRCQSVQTQNANQVVKRQVSKNVLLVRVCSTVLESVKNPIGRDTRECVKNFRRREQRKNDDDRSIKIYSLNI